MIRTCFEQCHEIHPKVLLDLLMLMLMLKMFIALQVLLILVTLVQCQPVFL